MPPRWSEDESVDPLEEGDDYVDMYEMLDRIDLQLSLQEEFLTEEERRDDTA